MMYFFLLKKTTTAKNLFGNNKLVDFSKNLSKKKIKQKQNKFDPPKKNHSYANKNEKKTEVETKQQQ